MVTPTIGASSATTALVATPSVVVEVGQNVSLVLNGLAGFTIGKIVLLS